MSGHDRHCHEHGRRGHRGKRGHQGEEGPPGLITGGSLLKFSGDLAADPVAGALTESFLPDSGTAFGIAPTLIALNYTVADDRALINMATRMSTIVPPGGQVLLELLLNGAPLSRWTISYGPGESGIKVLAVGPLPLKTGDRLDLRGTTSGFVGSNVVQNVSATLGVE